MAFCAVPPPLIPERIDHLIAENKVTLHLGDMADSSSIIRVVALGAAGRDL